VVSIYTQSAFPSWTHEATGGLNWAVITTVGTFTQPARGRKPHIVVVLAGRDWSGISTVGTFITSPRGRKPRIMLMLDGLDWSVISSHGIITQPRGRKPHIMLGVLNIVDVKAPFTVFGEKRKAGNRRIRKPFILLDVLNIAEYLVHLKDLRSGFVGKTTFEA
jgi:hypothetical protein